jgi:poly(hydroxyalkanoate) depolymerase family esterase
MKRAVAGTMLIFAFAALAPVTHAASKPSGTFTRHTFDASDPTFSRDYLLFAPQKRSRPTSLVVYLHGCNQTATDAALGTRWNELAARRGFFVVYPEQRVDQSADGNASGRGNGAQCWNWFRPDLMGRDVGEPATIAGIARIVTERFGLDARRVYVAGASAGADLAVAVAALYPDLVAALGVFAGCPYLNCSDASGASAHRAMGAYARAVPVFAVQGTSDYVNNIAMGSAAVQQWLGTDDLADNGSADGSISSRPASVEHHGLDESAVGGPGGGDPCAYPTRHPCLGGVLGFDGSYPYTVATYVDADDRAVVESWFVHGLGHAYPDGNTEANWTDPLGPDITTASYEFFTAHPMR